MSRLSTTERFVDRADVAIVGGGVIGWSIAYHLLKSAPSLHVVVLERYGSFGMGSTGRAAGGVRAQFGTAVNIDLSRYSIRFFERFLAETGVDPGFRQYGYLFVTASDGGATYLETVTSLQRERDVAVQLLSANQVANAAPYIRNEDIVAGAFSGTDGYLDPYAVCQGFAQAARALGAKPRYGCDVLGLADAGICTSNGELSCKQIVLAMGHWSSDCNQRFSIELPISPEKHQLAIAGWIKGLPEELPMVVDLDTSFHFRREGDGLLIGYNDELSQEGDPNAEPLFDYGFLERLAGPALHRLPELEKTGFDTKKSWAGFYAETPDRHAIIGKVGQFFVATGFGGHGVMHSPAAGKAASELILNGESSTLDIHALRPSRFAESDLTLEPMVI